MCGTSRQKRSTGKRYLHELPSPHFIWGGASVDIETITNLLSNFAFPVVCVVALFAMWYRETDKHEAEMDKMTEALNNNTLAMQKLVDKLGGM